MLEFETQRVWAWIDRTSGDIPHLREFDLIKGANSSRVIPTATELSITTVEPGLAYFSMV